MLKQIKVGERETGYTDRESQTKYKYRWIKQTDYYDAWIHKSA